MIQPEDRHNFTRKEKSTIAAIVVFSFLLFGIGGYFIGKGHADPAVIDNSKELAAVKKSDSLELLLSLKLTEISEMQKRDAQSDSFFVHNFIKSKNEKKYIASLDSVAASARIDSLFAGFKAH